MLSSKSLPLPPQKEIELLETSLQTLASWMLQQWNDSPRCFLAKYLHRTETEEGITFNGATLWQLDICKDEADSIVVEKCSQVGVTVLAIIRMLDWLRQGLPGIYALPSKTMMEVFVKNRIDPILNDVEWYKMHYATKTQDASGSQLKTIFNRRVKFAGSNVKKHFFEFPASWYIIDEHDLCDMDNLKYLNTRLGRSEKKRKMIIGNPTYENQGIDELYRATDQKQWHITCGHCKEEQTLNWFENCVRQVGQNKYVLRDRKVQAAINRARKTERHDIAIEVVRNYYEKKLFQDARIYCKNPKCQKPMNRHSNTGRWIAKHPDRPVSGYHVNKIFADPFIPAIISLYLDFIRAQHVPILMQVFMNTALGIPYEVSTNRITEQLIGSAVQDYVMPFKIPIQVMQKTIAWTVAGVDVGDQLHVHISGMWLDEHFEIHRCKLFVGTVGGGIDDLAFEKLDDLCKRFSIQSGVIDKFPEARLARKFVKAHPGWWMAQYSKTDSQQDHVRDPKTKILRLDRTESLDMSMAEYGKGNVVVPMNFRSLDDGEFVNQMKMPVRHTDPQTGRAIWTKGNDHHRHADTYEMWASKLVGITKTMKAA